MGSPVGGVGTRTYGRKTKGWEVQEDTERWFRGTVGPPRKSVSGSRLAIRWRTHFERD